jgi:hypothetical protein
MVQKWAARDQIKEEHKVHCNRYFYTNESLIRPSLLLNYTTIFETKSSRCLDNERLCRFEIEAYHSAKICKKVFGKKESLEGRNRYCARGVTLRNLISLNGQIFEEKRKKYVISSTLDNFAVIFFKLLKTPNCGPSKQR